MAAATVFEREEVYGGTARPLAHTGSSSLSFLAGGFGGKKKVFWALSEKKKSNAKHQTWNIVCNLDSENPSFLSTKIVFMTIWSPLPKSLDKNALKDLSCFVLRPEGKVCPIRSMVEGQLRGLRAGAENLVDRTKQTGPDKISGRTSPLTTAFCKEGKNQARGQIPNF